SCLVMVYKALSCRSRLLFNTNLGLNSINQRSIAYKCLNSTWRYLTAYDIGDNCLRCCLVITHQRTDSIVTTAVSSSQIPDTSPFVRIFLLDRDRIDDFEPVPIGHLLGFVDRFLLVQRLEEN